ncbi:hypothetical protein A3H80_04225 [Candidatus Roizmanbacteria bacterium RIFCSPLOWO2_02_FULL_37_19]|uniref:Uncharacterized protein n=1 Tax=Candidatus Roizmanbacteria bacterium RIFCSPHIGHO2_02_FULL_37_24 TaxID=1802037 RepID=A0A1F7GXX5_9BACT|nr:MAG: hypothetical protein A2862_04320 [Candidatus Roizmanbacteria bacterium RIFCSPHIGHO2_01_FULL_38_41]OGK23947.1 MAG: hypothetical protein A3C24_00345 [Candidatus Roizmanbacteria bacterium RIFCSPHIGHO2_02_FULL_37_24]OGK32456.1 MAG: hypothetical protein A3E10_00135 [Candidatus Roizmanbacteria bacterium RIFCSPHIGHO2_12_FULL_37_23]OGK53653.1 MAG: hypothetical protein A3H80_04225 [Candidatus Roizmanbacteria bacterium RIFCSPLOWO2_02_FULL_37_19]OGK60198.1 MAG: hypothetical protein A3G65_01220 [Ca
MSDSQKYYIKTFGCQQNEADSERIKAALEGRGMKPATSYKDAQYVVINTCMIRESAENRVYGLVHNLGELKTLRQTQGQDYKIIITGCMVGVAFRDKTGKVLQKIKKAMPAVDEFMPIEEVGFDFAPLRTNKISAWVPISNGCNNFCTFCIVPFTRGREISRPYQDIIDECRELKKKGYKKVTLLGQNVNSYGSDLILGEKNIQVMRDLPGKDYFEGIHNSQAPNNKKFSDLTASRRFQVSNSRVVKPVYVKHLGRLRIPTLFPYLLNEVAEMGFEVVDFISSNPWDFSDELIDVIAGNKNITRTIHLPVQSGDDAILRRMNRWYTSDEYLSLVSNLKSQISNLKFTTDIIVGFCGETERQFKNTMKLCKKVGFLKAYIAVYSSRPMTAATKVMKDDIPHEVKKRRWQILDDQVNKPNLKKSKGIHVYN